MANHPNRSKTSSAKAVYDRECAYWPVWLSDAVKHMVDGYAPATANSQALSLLELIARGERRHVDWWSIQNSWNATAIVPVAVWLFAARTTPDADARAEIDWRSANPTAVARAVTKLELALNGYGGPLIDEMRQRVHEMGAFDILDARLRDIIAVAE